MRSSSIWPKLLALLFTWFVRDAFSWTPGLWSAYVGRIVWTGEVSGESLTGLAREVRVRELYEAWYEREFGATNIPEWARWRGRVLFMRPEVERLKTLVFSNSTFMALVASNSQPMALVPFPSLLVTNSMASWTNWSWAPLALTNAAPWVRWMEATSGVTGLKVLFDRFSGVQSVEVPVEVTNKVVYFEWDPEVTLWEDLEPVLDVFWSTSTVGGILLFTNQDPWWVVSFLRGSNRVYHSASGMVTLSQSAPVRFWGSVYAYGDVQQSIWVGFHPTGVVWSGRDVVSTGWAFFRVVGPVTNILQRPIVGGDSPVVNVGTTQVFFSEVVGGESVFWDEVPWAGPPWALPEIYSPGWFAFPAATEYIGEDWQADVERGSL